MPAKKSPAPEKSADPAGDFGGKSAPDPAQKSRPALSVVIHHFQEWRHLRANFAGWRRAKNLPGPVEIVVVDSSVDPEITEKVRQIAADFPEARVIRDPDDRGVGAGWRRGAIHARAPWIIFSNADMDPTHFDPEAPARLLDFAEKTPGGGIFAPKLFYSDGRIQESFRAFPRPAEHFFFRSLFRISEKFRARRERRFREKSAGAEPFAVEWVVGCFFLVRRDFFREISKNLLPVYMFLEDADICREARHAGKKVYFCPGIKMLHGHARASEAPIWRLPFKRVAWVHFFSLLRFFWKWRGGKNPPAKV